MSTFDNYKKRLSDISRFASKYDNVLKSIDDEDLKSNIALMIHNQETYNAKYKLSNFFKQISIPSTIHFLFSMPYFLSIQANRIFDDQAISDKDHFYYLNNAGDINSIESKFITATSSPSILIKSLDLKMNPGDLNVQCAEITITMLDDLVHFSVVDMIENAQHQLSTEVQSTSGIIEIIEHGSNKIKESIGKSANFVILPVLIAKSLQSEMVTMYDFDALPINIKRIGCLHNKFNIYINGYETNRILVGYRGLHPLDAGMIYYPSVLFFDPKKEDNHFVIHKLDGTHLVNPNYFASIELIADKTSFSI